MAMRRLDMGAKRRCASQRIGQSLRWVFAKILMRGIDTTAEAAEKSLLREEDAPPWARKEDAPAIAYAARPFQRVRQRGATPHGAAARRRYFHVYQGNKLQSSINVLDRFYKL